MPSTKLNKSKLIDLLGYTVDMLMERVRDGTASPKDVDNIIKILKDNDINILTSESKKGTDILNDVVIDADEILEIKSRVG